MSTEILGVLVTIIVTVLLSYPFGKYCSKVFKGEKVWTDFFNLIEKFIFRISGINPNQTMDWKQNMKALLGLNLVFFLWAYIILIIQGAIPFWNPAAIISMEATLAFNTAASFTTNTNLQHYSGETGLSYLSQILVICFLQFVTAATGIAAMALLFKALVQKRAYDIGNFYRLFLLSGTRILLPLSILVAILLMLNGSPSNFDGPYTFTNLQGDTVTVAAGPVAQVTAIKQLGTNGGGYFGPNSTHPF